MNTILDLHSSSQSILWPKQHKLLKETLLVLGGIVLLALSAQFVIPMKPVPLTFQSSTVILLGMAYGARLAGLTVMGYLMAGLFGAPIFAQMASGFSILTGATAGYLISFVPAAVVAGFLAQKGWAKSIGRAFLTACLSACLVFASGVAVLAQFVGFKQAVLLGVAPFVVTELLKLFAIALVTPKLWKRK